MKNRKSKENPYAFKRDDNGKVVWVDWSTMMQQSSGYITLPDGVFAKRCVHLEEREDFKKSDSVDGNITRKPAPSDSLGFPEQCLAKFESDRQKHGFSDIEFKRDPRVPEFYQVHCSSQAAKDRYTKHRQLVNRTSTLGSGHIISAETLEKAEAFVKKLYGSAEPIVLKSQVD